MLVGISTDILTWINEGVCEENAPGDAIQDQGVNVSHSQEHVNIDMVNEKCSENYNSSKQLIIVYLDYSWRKLLLLY
jgi:hypothetical protein